MAGRRVTPPSSSSSHSAPSQSRSALLLLLATVVLIAFYYLTRADTIGVSGPGKSWFALTRPPLRPGLHFVSAAILLGLIPLLAARRLTGLDLRALGLGLGKWRSGLVCLAVGIPLAILAGRIAALSPAMRAVYPLDPSLTPDPMVFARSAAIQFLYFGAWEVLFRGVLLFGLLGLMGSLGSICTQTAVSVTAHFGRAINEAVSALPAGVVFGWVTLRLQSIWYIAVLHWLVAISMDWFILTT